MQTLTIRKPDDWHVHLRQDEMLEPMVRASAGVFKRVRVMPNTNPAILDSADALVYQQRIESVGLPGFEPMMTIKLVPETTPRQIEGAYKHGIRAAKLYPDGVTTGSAGGVRDFKALAPVFATMEEVGMTLCLHGEDPGKDVFCLDREQVFLQSTLPWILWEFSGLKVVMEHLSTAAAVNEVRYGGHENLAATITVHHLMTTLDDVVGDKLMPHHFCKPLPKRPQDRARLLQAVTEPGQTKFFLGTDSAPHQRGQKECSCGAAGVFTAPWALPLLTGIFERENALDCLERFTSVNGALFHELPLNEETITLVREPQVIPDSYEGVASFMAGQQIEWKIEER